MLVNYALKFNRRAQNVFLCLASLLFYAWGEPRFVLVMMVSILVNWFFGLLVGKFKENKNVRWLIALDVFINLSIIF
ncbi:MAG: MBOAT family protein, partial [Clostridia bacterium]|nr:MBOAT family protein [Clostridia bacterium]